MRTRTPILAVAGVLLVAGATLALAAGPGHGGHRPGFGPGGHDCGGPGGRPGFGLREEPGAFGPFGRALDRLDLTGEQRDQVRAILERHRDERTALREKMRDRREERFEQDLALPFDEAAVRARAEERARGLVEAEVARARVASEVLAVLTPGQRAELGKMREERHERFEHRWGRDDDERDE
jgi:Spy/CpxP family protein refolding chaperone